MFLYYVYAVSLSNLLKSEPKICSCAISCCMQKSLHAWCSVIKTPALLSWLQQVEESIIGRASKWNRNDSSESEFTALVVRETCSPRGRTEHDLDLLLFVSNFKCTQFWVCVCRLESRGIAGGECRGYMCPWAQKGRVVWLKLIILLLNLMKF